MPTIPEIVTYLKYGRAVLFEAIEGLSHRELTEPEIYPGWTIKDVLAHIIGWDEQVIENLSLIQQGQAEKIGMIDVEVHNQTAVTRWRDKPWAEVLAAVHYSYQQIIDIIMNTDYHEIDRRHERQGRMITIRSYIIETMVEHIRQHSAEIELWRQALDEAIEPSIIIQQMKQSRANFMALLDTVDEAEALTKQVIGHWSISDMVGHIVDWEQRMLQAAHHIYDPARPTVPPVAEPSLDWNEIMATQRANKSWPENHHELRETQIAVDNFLIDLSPGDWNLRGPYPWPKDQGSLAELIISIGQHYDDHTPDLQRWYERK